MAQQSGASEAAVRAIASSAAPASPAARSRAPPGSYMGAGELDQEHRQAFFATAGALAVVEGTEFAFHKDILARRSKLLAKLLQDIECAGGSPRSSSEGGEVTAAAAAAVPAAPATPAGGKQLRGGEAEGRQAGGGGLLRLEAPFAGFGTDAMRGFLRLAYTPTADVAAAVVREATSGTSYEPLRQTVRLADYLDAPGLLAQLDRAIYDLASGFDVTAVGSWMPVLALADEQRATLPRAYGAVLGLATKSVTASCSSDSAGATPAQRFVGDSLFAALSPETTGIVLLSAVSTLRSVPGLPDLTAVKPSLVQPQDSAACSGSYVWEWRPGCGLEDEAARTKQQSPVFAVSGVLWQMSAFLNGMDSSSRGHVSAFLHAVPDGGEAVAARRTKFSLSIQGAKGARTYSGCNLVDGLGWGWPRMVSHAELKEKQLMVDGLINIKLEISELSVYDV